ncbi:MAG: Acetyl-coenzyme A synthetase [Alphaproteobacteria bacterium MarineAlpha9_Bin4]|nr:acetate--CoA ligase [Pelagibacterales bacterium]PPR24922.1 MAG: Acetyl-coenzyme A synthetase [Alphaproteobacteria bacterium MarineAlpha9_Bin4]
MSDIYKTPEKYTSEASIDKEKYIKMYNESINDPDVFWEKHAKRVNWIKSFTKVKDISYDKNNVFIKWFEDGTLNVSTNCIDRHLKERGDKIALLWQGDNPNDVKKITYSSLLSEVSLMSNILLKYEVKKGDRVTIYMPMIPEAVYAMLACARIGAIHSVVFGGFSPESLADRIKDCKSDFVITADESIRGGKIFPLKSNVDEAIDKVGHVRNVLVVKRTGGVISFDTKRDIWWHEEKNKVDNFCKPVEVNAEDPLFILYTSGSTGKPKGVLHTSGGYLVYASLTHEYIFNYKENDIYWCTADVGWITGHSYIVYGPLCNGATTLIYEGLPNYPDASRFWEICDKHSVNTFYTAPTALRAIMREGDDFVTKTSRASLKLLGTVGEPINPEAWKWYYEVVGDKKCPIVDTWWQTETGGILISPLPGAIDLKPGSATIPFFGIQPAIVDKQSTVLEGVAEGNLVITDSWPGQMRTVYGDHQRFIDTYFSTFDNVYFTGDGAKRDEDGYYWITGRVDDVINVSGHRLGTAEIESALVSHKLVAEAAVVGFPHEIKGQGIYAYVTLKAGNEGDEELKQDLLKTVSVVISPIAKPENIQWAPNLPKTRSGKIMRRILRKIAANEISDLGDTSTLADPSAVKELIENRLIK